jgi:hypothetical protein
MAAVQTRARILHVKEMAMAFCETAIRHIGAYRNAREPADEVDHIGAPREWVRGPYGIAGYPDLLIFFPLHAPIA